VYGKKEKRGSQQGQNNIYRESRYLSCNTKIIIHELVDHKPSRTKRWGATSTTAHPRPAYWTNLIAVSTSHDDSSSVDSRLFILCSNSFLRYGT
jgi:hypothetical protein